MSGKMVFALTAALSLVGPELAGAAGIDMLRGERRVLVVSAPSTDDAGLQAQRDAIAAWRDDAQARDVTVVQIVGNTVDGTSDTASALRARYRLAADRFAAALVGKDGHVALRSAKPLTGEALNGTIDAMPMRRAGQR